MTFYNQETTSHPSDLYFIREEPTNLTLVEPNSELRCRWKPDTTLTYVNQVYCNLMGKQEHELLGTKWLDFIPELRRPQVKETYDNLAKNPTIHSIEHEMLDKFNQIHWQHWVDCPIFDKQGQVVEFESVAKDISQRKRMEVREQWKNLILTSLAKDKPLLFVLKLIINWLEAEDPRAKGSIMLLDDDGKHLNFGAAPSLSENFKQQADGVKIGYNQGTCGEAAYTGKRVISQDILANPRWQQFHSIVKDTGLKACWSEPIFSSTDQVLGTFAIYYSEPKNPDLDDLERINVATNLASLAIEDYKKAEQLRISEQKFRSFVENASDIVFAVDENANFTYISPNCRNLLGHDPREVMGKNARDFVHPDDWEHVVSHLREALKNRDLTKEIEYRIQNQNGEWKWHASTYNTFEEYNDQAVVLGIARDITERKRAEERIRYLSFHDSLTNLYNRAFVEEELMRIDTARQQPISMILVDLNGLKLINDAYGHQAGDELLKTAADILKRSTRKEDIVARWGGDEFVIVLPQTTNIVAKNVCDRIIDNCQKTYVRDAPVSLAVGTATKISEQENTDSILKRAEDNMYNQKLSDQRSSKSAVLNTLLKTLEAKSHETQTHTNRMNKIARKLGRQIGLPDSELSRLNLAITSHDIGKINISEEVLTKDGPLTKDEWEEIKKHPITGYRIAMATKEFASVAEEIMTHHENWDGTGYPYGLKGEDIPLLARVAAIADAYEIMANGRPYKSPMSREEIIEEFQNQAGKQFDPNLVKIFLESF